MQTFFWQQSFDSRICCCYAGAGQLISSDVAGTVQLRAKLSGMPQCKIGINDSRTVAAEASAQGPRTPSRACQRAPRHQSGLGGAPGGINLEDASFHQCVRLAEFDRSREIMFTPPEGQTDLINYR